MHSFASKHATYRGAWRHLSSRWIHVHGPRLKQTVPNSNLPTQVDLLDKYRALVALGHVNYDEEQVRVIMQLRRIQKQLISYAPPALPSRLLQSHDSFHKDTEKEDTSPWWLASEGQEHIPEIDRRALVTIRTYGEELAQLDTPKGLLITGPPGSGKSFLVDLWYSTVPTPYKARKHYNQLVLEIYRAVWEETQRRMAAVRSSGTLKTEERVAWTKAVRQRWQEVLKTGTVSMRWSQLIQKESVNNDPPIAFVVAQKLVLRHWLLVFDEIQLLDVSSASLLADVISWYWRMGGIIVGTSNKVPDDLYKNGVQRDRLEPFVEALKVRCPVLTLDNNKDWRVEGNKDGLEHTWYTYDQEAEYRAVLDNILSGADDVHASNLTVFGRIIHLPSASNTVCKFSFSELCEQSLGPADYLTLTSSFPIMVIENIPILPLSLKNQARRFISLIDALYESRCKLVCLAKTKPQDLFFPDAISGSHQQDTSSLDALTAEAISASQELYRPNVSAYDSPKMAEAPVVTLPLALDRLSIFSGADEQFAFKRALSRLLEMTSAKYNTGSNVWSPLPASARMWERSITCGYIIEDLSTPCPAQQTEPRNEGLGLPNTPHLSPNHIWGVREDWSEGVGVWGKGSKIYRRK